jgi:hypothetical protein
MAAALLSATGPYNPALGSLLVRQGVDGIERRS